MKPSNRFYGIAIVCLTVIALGAFICMSKRAEPPRPPVTVCAPEELTIEEKFGPVIPQRKPSDAVLLKQLNCLVDDAKSGDGKAMAEVRALLSSSAKNMPEETVIRLMEILLEWREEQMNDAENEEPTEGPST